jgi:hypothetical protein
MLCLYYNDNRNAVFILIQATGQFHLPLRVHEGNTESEIVLFVVYLTTLYQ